MENCISNSNDDEVCHTNKNNNLCKFTHLIFDFTQNSEYGTWKMNELSSRVSELEDSLSKTQRELHKAQENSNNLHHELRENISIKEEQVYLNQFCFIELNLILNNLFIIQEERLNSLEKKYLTLQRESTTLHDLNDKLEQELRHKETQLKVCVKYGGTHVFYIIIIIMVFMIFLSLIMNTFDNLYLPLIITTLVYKYMYLLNKK